MITIWLLILSNKNFKIKLNEFLKLGEKKIFINNKKEVVLLILDIPVRFTCLKIKKYLYIVPDFCDLDCESNKFLEMLKV